MTDSILSRRNLLAAAASAALAAPFLRAADAPKAKATSEGSAEPVVLRWGLIGTGTRGGGTHVPVLKSAPGSELLAMCDVSEERLATAMTRWGKKVTAYSDYQKLLANPDINAVIVAVPNLLHKEM